MELRTSERPRGGEAGGGYQRRASALTCLLLLDRLLRFLQDEFDQAKLSILSLRFRTVRRLYRKRQLRTRVSHGREQAHGSAGLGVARERMAYVLNVSQTRPAYHRLLRKDFNFSENEPKQSREDASTLGLQTRKVRCSSPTVMKLSPSGSRYNEA